MLTNCRLPLLTVMLCLFDSGCVSVQYCDRELPLEPIPASCHKTVEEVLPFPAAGYLAEKPWHSPVHAYWPSRWKLRREPEPPPIAPLIPPRSRFHPVPTRPAFARQVILESVPPLVPPAVNDPRPESINTPSINTPPVDDTGGVPLDVEAGPAPRQLSDELRVASPISPPAPTQAR